MRARLAAAMVLGLLLATPLVALPSFDEVRRGQWMALDDLAATDCY